MEGVQVLAEDSRQVYLREGTVVLRWLFGYYGARRLPGWSKLPSWPPTQSTWKPEKPHTVAFRVANLVSIDVDELKEQDGIPVQFHIGISILRTQDLHSQCHSKLPHRGPCQNIIQSYHWVIEDLDYLSRHDNLFCFGRHRHVSLSNLGKRLCGLVGRTPPIILVVHGGHRETTLLQKLKIDLNPILTIDTTKAVRFPLQIFYNYTLKKLLAEFGIPFTGDHLHVAGNDAHFTLRVLLMIAVRDSRRELKKDPQWVPLFESIAQAPLPPMPLKRSQKGALTRRAKAATSTEQKTILP